MRTQAHFPALDQAAGHYESFYLKASDPSGGRAIWIRHTVHKRPGEEPTCSLWVTAFDRQAGAPTALKQNFAAGSLETPEGAYIAVAGAEIGPGSVVGSAEAGGHEARWELRFDDRHEPLMHLPKEWMYRRSIPRTKLLSPHPGASFSGWFELDGSRWELGGWPGMVGHNWGAEHAERWTWIQAPLEGAGPDDYIDIAAGRVKLGPLTTPWVANGRIVIDGEALVIGGLGNTYGTSIDAEPGSCSFEIAGKNVTVKGRVGTDLEQFVGWIYSDPDGGEHNTVNSSIADLELRVERPGHRHAHLEAKGTAAYELGMRETDHGVPIQPFGDG